MEVAFDAVDPQSCILHLLIEQETLCDQQRSVYLRRSTVRSHVLPPIPTSLPPPSETSFRVPRGLCAFCEEVDRDLAYVDCAKESFSYSRLW